MVSLREKNKKTILVVDDEPKISEMYKMMFELEGFNCVTANDALTALKLAKQYKPEIILSDLVMPVINGFDFRERVVEEKDLSDIPFVFLTSNSTEENMLKGFDLSIRDYILKTTSHKIIIEKVKAILSAAAKEREITLTKLTDAAKETSSKLLPEAPPNIEGYKISQLNIPFEETPGGDFIDYIQLDADRTIIVLGDVMGKKWGAWFFSFAYVNYIRSAIRNEAANSGNANPAKILQRVNDALLKDNKISEIFTTVSLMLIDSETQTIKYSGAGDLPVLFRKGKNGTVTKLSTKGINLGLIADGEYDEITFKTEKGDMLYLYTDGIIETRNENGKQFGMSGFIESIKQFGNKSNFLTAATEMLKEFSSGEFVDDISIIAVKSI